MEELTIVVDKNALLRRLNNHKKRFGTSFNAVLKAYKKKSEEYQKQYSDFAQKVADGKVKDQHEQPNPPPQPLNRTKDYDFYIDMMSNHSLATIELTEDLYKRLWNDKWEWTHHHYNTLMFYARAGGSGSALMYPHLANMATAYSDGE